MTRKSSADQPDGKSLGLPDYLIWVGNQLTATAVAAYGTLGVGFLEARILFVVGRAPDQLSTHLVQQLGVDRAAISRALQQLKGAGLIVADERRRLTLSDSGWAKRAQVVRIADERLARFTAGLSEAELEQLLGLVRRLHRNVPDLFDFNTLITGGSGRLRRSGRSSPQRA